MATEEKPRLMEHFSSLTDPRVVSKTRHKLIDIIVITLCAMLAGSYGQILCMAHWKRATD